MKRIIRGMLSRLGTALASIPHATVLLGSLLLFGTPADARIILVRQDGMGDHADIAPAIAAATHGDIVLVGDGIYSGELNRNLDPGSKKITIASENGTASCIIEIPNWVAEPGFFIHSGEDSTTVIRGFTIRNSQARGIHILNASPSIHSNVIEGCSGGGIHAENSRSVISHNVIQDNTVGYGTSALGGGLHLRKFRGVVSSNVIKGNAAGKGGGVYVRERYSAYAPWPLLINNLIVDNDAWGAGGEGGGIYAYSGTHVGVRNCTIARNSCYEYESGGGVHGWVGVSNSIVWLNTPYWQFAGTGWSANYCCVMGGVTGGEGNIADNPQFVSDVGGIPGDYHLRATSPCIDAGLGQASSILFAVTDGSLTVGLHQYTTRADEIDDSGTVDMGFHYRHYAPRYIHITSQFTSIQAAVNVAVPQDVFVVRAGGYAPFDFQGKPIRIVSESGPAVTRISPRYPNPNTHCVVALTRESTDSILEGFTLYANDGPVYGAGVLSSGASPTFRDLIIHSVQATYGAALCFRSGSSPLVAHAVIHSSCYATSHGGGLYCDGGSSPLLVNVTMHGLQAGNGGSAVAAVGNSHPVLRNCILNNNAGASVAYTADASTITSRCSDVHGNAGGDWVGPLAGQDGLNGNISLNPEFCDPEYDNFTLQGTSPCAAENNPGCGQIGALGVGCASGVHIVRPDGTGDYPTIQAAIDASLAGSTVLLADGTFTGVGNRDLTYRGKAITVRSQSGDPTACIIDCQGIVGEERRGFIFNQNEGPASILENVTIRNARAWHAAGLFCENGASPTITGCIFEHNTAESRGGGLSAHNGSAPTITACTFRHNTALTDGAALRCYAGAPTVTDCVFYSNSSGRYGGAVYLNNNSAPSFQGCLLYDNTAASDGGGLYGDSSQPTLTACTLSGNDGPGASGIMAAAGSAVTVHSSIIAFGLSGAAVACGGGGAGVTLSCSDVYGNAGGDWVGCIAGQETSNGNLAVDPLFCDAAAGNLTLSGASPCAAANNPGCGQIGALDVGCERTFLVRPDGMGDFPTIQAAIDECLAGDTVLLADGTFTGVGNRDLTYRGKAITVRSQSGDPTACIIDCQGIVGEERRGFIFNQNEGPASILENVTIRNARAWHAAGLFCENGASPTITGCIFEHNTAESRGGGLSAHNGSAPTITACTFRHNTALTDGAALRCYAGAPTVTDCVFYSNSSGRYGGAVYLNNNSAPSFQGCLLYDNTAASDGGGLYGDSSQPTLTACTLSGNDGPGASGIMAAAGSAVTVHSSIIAFGLSGAAVACGGGGAGVTLSCSDVYGNAGGDWVGCIAGQETSNGNLSANPLFCNAAAGNFTLNASSPCLPANNSCGLQMGAFGLGCSGQTEVPETELPPAFFLAQNVPNPFNPKTAIRFGLPDAAEVTLAIYDLSGRRLRALLTRVPYAAGFHRVDWDGTDDAGRRLASGMYICRLSAGGRQQMHKMTLVK